MIDLNNCTWLKIIVASNKIDDANDDDDMMTKNDDKETRAKA